MDKCKPTKVVEKCHPPCNICYHIGWTEGSMIKGCDVIAYAGHIILRKHIQSINYHVSYCGECDTDNEDLTSIIKKNVVSIDTICNARLNLCFEHVEQLKEQNSIE